MEVKGIEIVIKMEIILERILIINQVEEVEHIKILAKILNNQSNWMRIKEI